LAKTPLHGSNLYPEHPQQLGPCVDEWFKKMSDLGVSLLKGIALALTMPEHWFQNNIA